MISLERQRRCLKNRLQADPPGHCLLTTIVKRQKPTNKKTTTDRKTKPKPFPWHRACTVINYQGSQQAGCDPYMGAVSRGRGYNVLSVIGPSVYPSRHQPLHTASFLSVLCLRTWQGNSSHFKTERDEEAETGSCSLLAFPGKVVWSEEFLMDDSMPLCNSFKARSLY